MSGSNNPYQAPNQFGDENLPRTSLNQDEKSFVLFCQLMAVMAGFIAGLGGCLIAWVAADWIPTFNLQPFAIRAAIIVGCGVITSLAVGYLQLRKVEVYRQNLLNSDSHKSRKEMKKLVEAAKLPGSESESDSKS